MSFEHIDAFSANVHEWRHKAKGGVKVMVEAFADAIKAGIPFCEVSPELVMWKGAESYNQLNAWYDLYANGVVTLPFAPLLIYIPLGKKDANFLLVFRDEHCLEDPAQVFVLSATYNADKVSVNHSVLSPVLNLATGFCDPYHLKESRYSEQEHNKGCAHICVRATLAMIALTAQCTELKAAREVSELTHGRRAAAGQYPLANHYVLKLRPAQAGGRHHNQGNAPRTSPRLHVRAGHVRRLGETLVKVRHCFVGTADNGRIHKRYIAD